MNSSFSCLHCPSGSSKLVSVQSLPIGIQTFKDIRDGNYLYIDKTKWIYEMVKDPKGVYFFSRPRRFGKSLTLSTLKEIFEGNKELFEGLWISGAKYDWKKYPIIRVDFSSMKPENPAHLKDGILRAINTAAEKYQVCASDRSEQVFQGRGVQRTEQFGRYFHE